MNAEKQNNNLELRDMDQQKEKVLAKKREKEEIEGKSESIQNQINSLTKSIKGRRNKLLKLKKDQVHLEERKQKEIQTRSQEIRNLQLKLKEQLFFIQNLIPKTFIQQLGSAQMKTEKKEIQWGMSGHSIRNLQKPVMIPMSGPEDSYLSPYLFGLWKKKKKDQIDYPDLETMMKDGKSH